MHVLLILCLIFAAIYSCVSWLLPTVLAWLFMRKFHIKLKIGRIAVPKLILKDVTLSKDRYFIHINEISFQSSCFNSEINKLVSVVIRGVQINNNVEEKRSVVVETILKPLLSKQNSLSREGMEALASGARDYEMNLAQNKLDFRDKKLPHSLIMFAQFMGVHIFDASITLNDKSSEPFIVHATALEVHADGAAGGPSRALVFSTKIVEGRVMVVGGGDRLGEADCSFVIEGTVKADGPLNVEKIHATISNTVITFQDELYHFVQKHKAPKKYVEPCTDRDEQFASIITRLSPVIPKIFSLKIDATRIGCASKSMNKNFEMSLQSLHVNSRFSAASAQTSGAVSLPQVYVAFQMDQQRLTAGAQPLLLLHKLKLDAKLEKGVLNLYLIISTLNMSYTHNNAMQWYVSLLDRLRKSQALKMKNPAQKSSTPLWISHVFSSCVVQGCAELRGVCVQAGLKGGRTLDLGCGGVKVKLDQLLDTREEAYSSDMARLVVGARHWSTELLVDGGWCAAGRGRGRLREPPARRHHTWGSALLAVALVKWGSHGPRDSKVEAMMDCLRLEWSTAIAETIISLYECVQDYGLSPPPPRAPPAPRPPLQYRRERGLVAHQPVPDRQ